MVFKRSNAIACLSSSSLSVAPRIWFRFSAAVTEVSKQLWRFSGWKTTSLCLSSSSQARVSFGWGPRKSRRRRVRGLEGRSVHNYLVEQQQHKLIRRIHISEERASIARDHVSVSVCLKLVPMKNKERTHLIQACGSVVTYQLPS